MSLHTATGHIPSGIRRHRGVLRQLEHQVRILFPEINRVSRSMSRLADLSEDMRILSLNAELAAGRAGQRGVAVRALTQYTRGLVRRLMDINETLTGLSNLYMYCTHTLRTLRLLRQIEAASVDIGTAIMAGVAVHASDCLDRAHMRYLAEVVRGIEGLVVGINRVGRMVGVVDEVVAQAASIATNIAAEAVSAGLHEAEFAAVAETMRRYVEELQQMSDNAARSLRLSVEGCTTMQDILNTITSQGVTVTAAAAA
jgi:hypothetical protein